MIKNNGGVFGRNPTFNNVEVEGDLTVDGSIIGTVVAGGSNTQVQFNNAGVLDANAGLTYDSATETLRVRSHPTRYLTIGPDGVGASEILAYGNRALVLNSVESTVDIGDIGVIANGTAIQIDDPSALLNINCPNGTITVDSPTVTLTGTTASTSSTTGAVIVAGGVGIAKDSFINGHRIGQGLLADQKNLAVGYNALISTIALGIDNVAVGYLAGQNITSGPNNVMLGSNAGFSNTSGQSNMCIGNGAHYKNETGSYNVAIGGGAGHEQNNNSVYNVFLGSNAGYWMTSGNNTVAIGGLAGVYHANGSTKLTASSDSVYIGYNTRGFNDSDSNSVVIGANAIGIGANKSVIGNSSTTETQLFGQLTLDATACISAASATALALKTVVPAGTGVTPTIQVICPSAAYTLTNGTGAQKVFDLPLDTITLQASTTYMFEGQYLITTGTTTHITSMSFVLTNATMTNCTWSTVSGSPAALNAGTTGAFTAIFNSVAGGAINTTSGAANKMIRFQGIMRVNLGGTVVPNIAFSAAPGVTCSTLVGSYIRFYPIGANTINSVGTAIS